MNAEPLPSPEKPRSSSSRLLLGVAVLVALPTLLLAAYLYVFDPVGARAVPQVPAGFDVRLFAKDPLVRNPAALAFDAQGRLFVGMGPQYRMPKPDTPGDSVMLLPDDDADGRADTAKTFATGFNCIQSLAWHGRDLWVANAPDLTVVRDLDGDDVADEYVRVYTDLGNLEHGLHGLIWGPDGKLYMTKGNSKGLSQPGRMAPKPFRELWGVNAPADAPDFPPPQTLKRADYRLVYQDPNDDWGREGGFLRCDDMGANLEIVARGLRNPFDIVYDSGFDWLGTDNDQHEGDRIVMPFHGAHFGWGHRWSSHWTGERHPPTAPVSGGVFHGSGTGVVHYDAPQFPAEWRDVWFMNDWLNKTTYIYRPQWNGALLQPVGGAWQEFATAGQAVFLPTDMEIGPDGALWVLSWGKLYNRPKKFVRRLTGQTGEVEGRVFRIAWKDAPLLSWRTAKRSRPLTEWNVPELTEDLGGVLPVWRVAAQEELLRRGPAVKDELRQLLDNPGLPRATETWALWTLGRMQDESLDVWFAERSSEPHVLNVRLQSLRILAHRARALGRPLPEAIVSGLGDGEPRLRFAVVQAIREARQMQFLEALKSSAATETDRLTFYAIWNALREFAGAEVLQKLLEDPRAGLRRAALLALADLGQLTPEQVEPLARDAATADVAVLWLAKRSGNPFIIFEPQPGEFDREVAVWLTPGVKPSTIRYTTDGSTPTADSPVFPESSSIVLKATTTVKAALFVENKPVGDPAEASFIKSTGEPLPANLIQPRARPTSIEEAIAALRGGQPERGRALFSANGGAGCASCHRVGSLGRAFGPDLTNVGERNDPEVLIRSILAPNAAITEGYALLDVRLHGGGSQIGILREETDLHLTLALSDGKTVRVDQETIASRESLHASAMPAYDHLLSPEQVADLTAWLMTQKPNAQTTSRERQTPSAL